MKITDLIMNAPAGLFLLWLLSLFIASVILVAGFVEVP